MKKILIINKSDSTGGAAVVSRRLMEALRAEGADARMLVVEKLTDSPFVEVAAPPEKEMIPFLAERLKIFLANGLSRKTLFKIDTASDGLPLWEHPLVKGADLVLLNWVNQGMLSLRGVRRILEMGKPVAWTMHDMWCMTGVCHHAAECRGFEKECGYCPLLGRLGGRSDLSWRVWRSKRKLYGLPERLRFVAVSRWLEGKARQSSLLRDADVRVIPNAFNIDMAIASSGEGRKPAGDGKIRLLIGAARLDDPIKGLPVLVEATKIIAEKYPGLAQRMELTTFGGVKDGKSLQGMGIPHRHLGMVKGEENVREVYENADVLVSASSYETLPGTLVEAQAYGCIPVSFDQGGQGDIVDHEQTGYLASYSDNVKLAAAHLADGLVWAAGIVENPEEFARMRTRMRESVRARFSYSAVARAYLEMI